MTARHPTISILAALSLLACEGPHAPPRDLAGAAQAIRNGTLHSGHPEIGAIVQISGGGFCTGTLIGCQTVLTAAHCLDNSPPASDVFFIEGCANINSSTPCAFETFYEAQSYSIHPQYNPNNISSGVDLAVVRLKGVTSAAPRSISSAPIQNGWVNTLIGYGSDFSANSNTWGVKRIGTAQVNQVSTHFFRSRNVSSGDAVICNGDSGGPALHVFGEERVIGVASFGETENGGGCKNSSHAKLDINWILSTASNDVRVDGSSLSCPAYIPASCAGRCGTSPNALAQCQCDLGAPGRGDYCPDYGFYCFPDPPTVTILEPLTNGNYESPIEVRVAIAPASSDADDVVAATGVSLKVDGSARSVTFSKSGNQFSVVIDAAPGLHQIAVTATDAGGDSSAPVTSQFNVVKPPEPEPDAGPDATDPGPDGGMNTDDAASTSAGASSGGSSGGTTTSGGSSSSGGVAVDPNEALDPSSSGGCRIPARTPTNSTLALLLLAALFVLRRPPV